MKQQNYTSEEMKECLLRTFKFLKTFLKEHDLHYVACGGTVLGAVRHHGFIPWDDDIDIYMPRADYNRLLQMNDELKPYGYEIVSLRNKGYYIPFAKISHMGSTIWELKRHPFILGVFIDIFPLDEFEEKEDIITERQYKSHYYFDKYINAVSSYPVSFMLQNLLHFNIHNVGVYLLYLYRRRNPWKYLKDFLEFESSYVGGKGSKAVCVTQWEGRVFESEWFKDVIEMPFEDTTVTVPRQYDAYLRKLYGDYMKLPPEEKRVPHPHYFVDLHHRLTLEEIKHSK